MSRDKKKALLWLIIPYVSTLVAAVIIGILLIIHYVTFDVDEALSFNPHFYVPYVIIGSSFMAVCVVGTVVGIRFLIRNAHQQETMSPEYGYAGYWRRTGAGWIDIGIVIVGTIIASPFLGRASFLIGCVYFVVQESSSYEATLGMRVMRIKIVDLQGHRISWRRSLVRYLAKYLSMIPLFIGYFMTGMTHRRQAMHDMVANTLVIRTGHSLKNTDK